MLLVIVLGPPLVLIPIIVPKSSFGLVVPFVRLAMVFPEMLAVPPSL